MHKGRLEAFSDGVIAIIITIMVLELRPPEGVTLHDLALIGPKFVSYALSFVFVAIYWNNHHHMFQSVQKINGKVLWANMHLLFWLSTIPFVTAWLGEEKRLSSIPVAAYGLALLLDAIAYTILVAALISVHGKDSHFAKSIGSDFKGKISLVIYLSALVLAFIWPPGACALYVCVAAIWLIPDRRFEGVPESAHESK